MEGNYNMSIILERGNNDSFVKIGIFYDLSTVIREIDKILTKEKFDTYYNRVYILNGYTYNDYGSISDFFRYKEVPDEDEPLVKAKKTNTGKRKRKKD
jgi:hypothetical protein